MHGAVEAPMRAAYDKLVPRLKKLVPAQQLESVARQLKFIQRLREIRAARFVWAVVLSRFGAGRPGFEQARHEYVRLGGKRLWPRPFQMRFKKLATVHLFRKAFVLACRPWGKND